MNSCVPHRVIWGLPLHCVGPCLLGCPGSSVGRALCLDCRVSWVRVPPRAAHFFFEKSVVVGAVELFALHLCYLSPHYDAHLPEGGIQICLRLEAPRVSRQASNDPLLQRRQAGVGVPSPPDQRRDPETVCTHHEVPEQQEPRHPSRQNDVSGHPPRHGGRGAAARSPGHSAQEVEGDPLASVQGAAHLLRYETKRLYLHTQCGKAGEGGQGVCGEHSRVSE